MRPDILDIPGGVLFALEFWWHYDPLAPDHMWYPSGAFRPISGHPEQGTCTTAPVYANPTLYYKVRAYNGYGVSLMSNAVTPPW